MLKQKMGISNFICLAVYIVLSSVLVVLYSRLWIPDALIRFSGPAWHLQLSLLLFNAPSSNGIFTIFSPAFILNAGVYLGGMVSAFLCGSSWKARIILLVLWIICALTNYGLYGRFRVYGGSFH
jgi:hypothetical protein